MAAVTQARSAGLAPTVRPPAASAPFARGGRIELVIGPMFSGKSTELLRRIRRYRFARKECLLIKYGKDTRYSEDCVSTHDRVMLKAVSCDRLAQAMDLVGAHSVVGVDEGQFFPDLHEFCTTVANMGKIVVVAALDGTFAAQPFGSVCDLIPQSFSTDKLTAVCAGCCGDAEFSKRLSAETAVEVIGGSDTYAPMCRSCYFGTVPAEPDAPQKPRGRVELVIGPMFSGKSTELLRRIRRYRFARKECLLIKYSKDTRYSEDCVSTHDRVMLKAVSCDHLSQVLHLVGDYSVIGVDEGQFFPDLIEFCNKVANQGKTVVVGALDGTFAALPFGGVCNLVPFSTSVSKLRAVCVGCCGDAGFSKRLSADTAVEVIGGADTYAPMCRSCYYGGPLTRSPRPIHLPSPVPGSSDSPVPVVATASPGVTRGAADSPASVARPSPLTTATGSAASAAVGGKRAAVMAPIKRKLDMSTEGRRASSSSDSSDATACNEETKTKAAAASCR